MEITKRLVSVTQLTKDYSDAGEEGITGYSGRLNIRPKYQREFIYKDAQRDEVIRTVMCGFPLSVFYWGDTGNDTYEVIDGQQRTVSICKYVAGEFSVDIYHNGNPLSYGNLTSDEITRLMDYTIDVNVCSGTEREKLDWFRIINIAGEKLTDQELRNAVYCGEWTTGAKKLFSKSNCPAYLIGDRYLKGVLNRQDYLETALGWIADKMPHTTNTDIISAYMAQHQHDENCDLTSELWVYFDTVIKWVKDVFPTYRDLMKGLPWGLYYNRYSEYTYDPVDLERRFRALLEDDDVTKNTGIYEYLLSGNEKFLNIRSFDRNMIRKAYERQNGICPKCGKHYELKEMDADHITPWSLGGRTEAENCQMLCKSCNRRKGAR